MSSGMHMFSASPMLVVSWNEKRKYNPWIPIGLLALASWRLPANVKLLALDTWRRAPNVKQCRPGA